MYVYFNFNILFSEMNAESSRSHLVIGIIIETTNRATGTVMKGKVRMGMYINSSPPSAEYMPEWTGPALVQIMACRLIGAKPLSEPMLEYC